MRQIMGLGFPTCPTGSKILPAGLATRSFKHWCRESDEQLDPDTCRHQGLLPRPVGSQLLQDPGFQVFTLDGMDIIQPTKKPRRHEVRRAQKAENRKISWRRVHIEHVNSRVKRYCMLKEKIRLWKTGIRDMVMEIGCSLHNFGVRLTPSWTPMV
jgi:DDE superfamily endonuclease